MSGPPKGFADLADMPEDERITVIGEYVIRTKDTVAVCIDAKPKSKADRYALKLTKRFPGVRVIDRFKGPTRGCVTLKIGPVDESAN